MQRATYRFFDTAVTIETDSRRFLERFDRSYGRFRSDQVAAQVFRVELDGSPRLTIEGREIPGGTAEALSIYSLNAVLNRIADSVTSHILIHGAALRNPSGSGVMIAGRSGLGKTTLTVELLRHGCGFLSDEIAAVDRNSQLLDPFPRCVGRRISGAANGEKEIVDVGDPAAPTPPELLFILADPADVREKSTVFVVVDRCPAGLHEDLRRVPGVREATVLDGTAYPSFRLDLEAASLAAAEPVVADICERHGVLLLEVVRGSGSAPDFTREPVRKRLGTTEAAHELLGHLRCSPRSRLVREVYGGSGSRLLLALWDMCSKMACYSLTVGRLERMVELILESSTEQRP